MTEPARQLTSSENVADRPFVSIENYDSDIALMNYLLQDLRAMMRRYAKDEIALEPYQQKNWEVHGLERRIVVCDPDGLVSTGDCRVVGFFGNRRQPASDGAVDKDRMSAAERQLVEAFPCYPGILSYSSTELVDHYWANLVIHRDVEDKEHWRGCAEHHTAVKELAPFAYHSVRIHNGEVAGGVCGASTIAVHSTKYWDYDVEPVWTAARHL